MSVWSRLQDRLSESRTTDTRETAEAIAAADQPDALPAGAVEIDDPATYVKEMAAKYQENERGQAEQAGEEDGDEAVRQEGEAKVTGNGYRSSVEDEAWDANDDYDADTRGDEAAWREMYEQEYRERAASAVADARETVAQAADVESRGRDSGSGTDNAAGTGPEAGW